MDRPVAERTDILVIDDDRGIRETLRSVLSDEGFQVTLAQDGEAALALLRSGIAPALILLDLSMPAMDGPAFRAAQLREGLHEKVPVVVLSGAGSLDDALPDAAAFLKKPFGLDELLSTVARFFPQR